MNEGFFKCRLNYRSSFFLEDTAGLQSNFEFAVRSTEVVPGLKPEVTI